MLTAASEGYHLPHHRRDRHPPRELDRHMDKQSTHVARTCAVIGAGRLGRALGAGLRAAGHVVEGPLGRGADGGAAEVVLLCVPDAEIAAAAAAVAPRPGRTVGHCSGATGLQALAVHDHAFSLHPLMTVTAAGADLRGAGAGVDATTPPALAGALDLAAGLGLQAVRVAPEDRAAYHAAASMASNFLVTLEGAAERLPPAARGGRAAPAPAAGERALLAPLVRAAAAQWAELGARPALTGPIARGDEGTVMRQRAAV